ncbi:mannonate dehydratase [Jiella sp. MQZ9-1]|uniref:Mannonate dehydratase n=1 Tax=Jiella flava TaxID=2816857 RepID=A0A939JVS8_9HYPH|nr:mannonate dehydratase [Jiella flava]MBO0662302.1 mannonate dehydratase [Jiella flava]MCD2470867.1 mannonate dehydratase [Jiella flava]
MRQTWRWFGPSDLVSIDAMTQAGVEGVVSALHHVPTGSVWAPDMIETRKAEIATRKDGTPSGIAWEVVESLPVSEDIKKQTGDVREHIANYKTSLTHLKAAGIETVCYNFMPVLDWTRTDLAFRVAHGGTAMRFDLIDFAAFDIFILERPGSRESFSEAVVAAAERRFAEMDENRKTTLAENVVFGLPGAAEHFSLAEVRAHLAEYGAIDEDQLRRHFIDFLAEVAPVAEDLGMRLCCHPDDPPFPLLGLPRIMSSEAHYAAILRAVDLPANGITLCSGSLGVSAENDLPGMMERLGGRVHFLHLRNTVREDDAIPCSFYEAEHLAGDTDMVALVAAALAEEKRRKAAGRADVSIPFRPDHGQDILDDLSRKAQPGYPAIGRLKGLAELRGVMKALEHRAR